MKISLLNRLGEKKKYVRRFGAGIVFKMLEYKLSNACDRFFLNIYNSGKVKCNLCGHTANKFGMDHVGGRNVVGALCLKCGAIPRYRSLGFYLEKERYLSEGVRILDIAPAPSFSRRCKSATGVNYTSIDIESSAADQLMDVSRMTFANNYFNLIICYYVLEFVIDDKVALNEIFRCLKPGGMLLLKCLIDLSSEHTMEFAAPNPLRHNCLRVYGRDFDDRLKIPGFVCAKLDIAGQIAATERNYHGLAGEDAVYMFRKQS